MLFPYTPDPRLTPSTDDLIESQFDAAEWLPSAVVEINGQETSKYLEAFATQNVQGYVEPDADWNNLMSSAAGDIQDVLSNFEGSSIFYPGRENIAFKFENGTSLEDPYLAYFSIYTDPTSAPLIQTGQELYDWFVLGVDSTPEDNAATATSASPSATSSSDAIVSDTSTDTPDSTDTSQEPDATSTVSADPTPTPWGSVAYPQNPIVAQPDLGDTNGGVVTGYVLNDNVTAILSIPSFMLNPENAVSFSTTVQDFLTKSKAAGCTRVIIDLQRNEGGADLLATDTFKQFFPAIDPFGGSRQRAVKFADDLGNTFTQYYDTHLQADMQSPDYITLSASVWVATDYLNAEIGRNFSSWPEYFGPHPDHGDLFTTTSRDNLSSPVFTESAAGLVIYGYANRTATTTQPYPSKDVIILTDAFCTSACARFVEMMQHEGGARTVVAGGRPKTGPMQTVGGNRGAESYDSFSLDSDIDTAIQFNSSVEKQLPQGRDDIEFILDYAGFNLKDAVRKGEDTPLQFLYEPADCRIFYTQNTVYNYVNLWNYVIDAVYRNPSLCIAGSAKPPLPPNSIPPPQGSTIGSLIMKGLSQPQAASDSQPHKRSLFQPQKQNPSKPLEKRAIPFSVPSPTTLHTAQNDRPFDLDTCKKCTGGDICFQAPVCELGKIRTVSTCANKCGKGRPCRDPRFNICHQTSGKGSDVCISRATNDAIRQCGTPTKGTKAQQTQITDPALGNFQFKPGTTRPGRG